MLMCVCVCMYVHVYVYMCVCVLLLLLKYYCLSKKVFFTTDDVFLLILPCSRLKSRGR